MPLYPPAANARGRDLTNSILHRFLSKPTNGREEIDRADALDNVAGQCLPSEAAGASLRQKSGQGNGKKDFMSDSSVATPNAGGAPKVSKISEAVIRIAGNSQDGIQAIGGFLARLAGRSEQEVMTFMTIPSTISGGPSIFQVRIGSGEVLSAGRRGGCAAGLLPALLRRPHQLAARKAASCFTTPTTSKPKPEWQKDYHHVGVPISSLTVEAIGGTGQGQGQEHLCAGADRARCST